MAAVPRQGTAAATTPAAHEAVEASIAVDLPLLVLELPNPKAVTKSRAAEVTSLGAVASTIGMEASSGARGYPADQSDPPPHSHPPFPVAFLDFLKENDIDPSIYALDVSIPRYVRLKPAHDSYLPEIEAEFKCKLEKVGWLSHFFAIPPHIQIASTIPYRQGKIYGMDAASGAAVHALNVSSGDHVLDLCAAPGAKLCMLSDQLGSSGTLTGVDISRHRLAACRTMLQKYAVGDHCRLFVADGTSFSLLPVRVHFNSVQYGIEDNRAVFKEWNSKRCRYERRNANKKKHASMTSGHNQPELIFYGKHSGVVGMSMRQLFETEFDEDADSGYDKVLVDAECTHDGSVKHIHKYDFWGWDTIQHRLLDAQRLSNLTNLQLQLLANGFRLLKVGGTLVYSTCSLTIAQNEGVLEKFMLSNSSAELQEIEAAKNWPCKSGRIKKTLRFDPSTSQTSGLFIAKFVKLPNRHLIASIFTNLGSYNMKIDEGKRKAWSQ